MYDAKAFRDYYDAKYGAENVTSTTVANAPTQRINSNADKGVTVTSNASGRAVDVVYKDPVTGQVSKANIPYDSRGLPVFDDVSKYTTNIDMAVPYEKQFSKATLDLREAINTGKVDAGQFTAAQLSDIQKGLDRIKGYTWHHNAQSAPHNMQLIPMDVHKSVSHLGQGALSQGK